MPQPVIRIETIPVGPLGVNCCLVWAPPTGQGFVVDPGDNAEAILATIADLGFTPRAILLTHGHVDHIRAVGPVAEALALPVVLATDDHALYASPDNELLPWLPAAEHLPPPVSAVPAIPGLAVTVIPTPGHTPGGVCYYLPAEGVLLSGDTLFRGSVGRTDFDGGDAAALRHSLQARLLTLPPDTRVLPGHGPATTIGVEARTNPFVA